MFKWRPTTNSLTLVKASPRERIKKWLVKEGDSVSKDQALAEVETDKAVVEMPSPVAGTVLKMNHKEGDLVKVGEVS